MLAIGDKVPDFSFQGTSGLEASCQDYLGQWLVLYFYPKDSTPGCTLEGIDFREHYAKFTAANTVILGVSRDSVKSHETFKAKQQFPFELVSDPEEVLCQAFDVMTLKSMYGKQVRGIERSTFLINPQGIVTALWRGVRVTGHVADVYETLLTEQKSS
jgi:peroxiredoxin Q/BCP